MSLQQKSERSIEAAEYLQSKGLHCSSIHCYYYACFQLLCEKLFQKYTEIELRRICNRCTQKGGIHVKYTYAFVQFLHQTFTDQTIAVDFQTDMQYLKKLRTKADYKHYLTTSINNNKAQQLAIDCIATINSSNTSI